jgi:hypothetical protein
VELRNSRERITENRPLRYSVACACAQISRKRGDEDPGRQDREIMKGGSGLMFGIVPGEPMSIIIGLQRIRWFVIKCSSILGGRRQQCLERKRATGSVRARAGPGRAIAAPRPLQESLR